MNRPPLHIAITYQPKTMSDLSPAAQAVLRAFNNAPPDNTIHEPGPDGCKRAIAAALRAVADQVAPLFAVKGGTIYADTMRGVRGNLLSIANELDQP
jgi:hypothetical protein